MKITVEKLMKIILGMAPETTLTFDGNIISVEEVTKRVLINVDSDQPKYVEPKVSPVIQPVKPVGRPVGSVKQKLPKGFQRHAWKADDIEALKLLQARGLSHEEIGKALGRSAKAISCQWGKLINGKLPSRQLKKLAGAASTADPLM